MTSSIENVILQAQAINPYQPLAPTDAVYGPLFAQAFGQFSPAEQQAIWVSFLQSNNLLHSIGGVIQPIPNDAPTVALFNQFAASSAADIQNFVISEGFHIPLPLTTNPTVPSGGFWGNLFQPLFGTLSPQQQLAVWAYFLQSNNLTDPPPADAATQDLFTQYATNIYTNIEHFILAQGVQVNLPLLNPPTSGFYGTTFSSYFAGQTPLMQQQLWVQFLVNNNLTINAPTLDPTLEAEFVNFCSRVLTSIDNQDVQSPHEVRKRLIMTIAFESLLNMLIALQNTIGVQSQNLIFYGNMQQALTKQMSSVPTYIGKPDDSVKVPTTVAPSSNGVQTTDWASFKFGYNNISVANIADWWASNSLNPPPGGATPFTMTSQATLSNSNTPLFTLTFTPQSGNSAAGSITWNSQGFGSGSVTIPIQPDVLAFSAGGPQSQLQQAITHYASSFEDAFAAAWNNGPNSLNNTLNVNTAFVNLTPGTLNQLNLQAINAITPTSNGTAIEPRSTTDTSSSSSLELPWQHGYVVPAGQYSNASDGKPTVAGKYSDQAAKARGDINSRLQNFIENTRSRRQIIQNRSQQLQTNLDQSRQTISNQSDIMDDLLSNINDIIKTIFR